jgi:hypothetical protein
MVTTLQLPVAVPATVLDNVAVQLRVPSLMVTLPVGVILLPDVNETEKETAPPTTEGSGVSVRVKVLPPPPPMVPALTTCETVPDAVLKLVVAA